METVHAPLLFTVTGDPTAIPEGAVPLYNCMLAPGLAEVPLTAVAPVNRLPVELVLITGACVKQFTVNTADCVIHAVPVCEYTCNWSPVLSTIPEKLKLLPEAVMVDWYWPLIYKRRISPLADPVPLMAVLVA